MKICKHCFRMMKEEDLKNHVKMHKKNQIIMLNRERLQNVQGILELEKEIDLKRMKDMKEKYMKEKFEKIDKSEFETIYLSVYIRKLGGYIRNMIDYSFRVFYKLFRMPIERYVKDNK